MDMFVPSNFLEWLITVVFLVTTPIFLLVHLSQTSRARAGQHKKNMNIPKKPPSKTPDTLDTPFLGVLKVPFWGIIQKKTRTPRQKMWLYWVALTGRLFYNAPALWGKRAFPHGSRKWRATAMICFCAFES